MNPRILAALAALSLSSVSLSATTVPTTYTAAIQANRVTKDGWSLEMGHTTGDGVMPILVDSAGRIITISGQTSGTPMIAAGLAASTSTLVAGLAGSTSTLAASIGSSTAALNSGNLATIAAANANTIYSEAAAAVACNLSWNSGAITTTVMAISAGAVHVYGKSVTISMLTAGAYGTTLFVVGSNQKAQPNLNDPTQWRSMVGAGWVMNQPGALGPWDANVNDFAGVEWIAVLYAVAPKSATTAFLTSKSR